MYKFRGVPRVFETRDQAMSFLRNSPGYVQRQQTYLKKFWPGLVADLGVVGATEERVLRTRSDRLRGVKSKPNVFDIVAKKGAAAVEAVAKPAEQFVTDVGTGIGLATTAKGDPRKVQQQAALAAQTQKASVFDPALGVKAAKLTGEVLGNAAGETVRMALGAPVAPVAFASDPKGFVKGVAQDTYDRYKRLAQGDLTVLRDRPVSFLVDAWAGAAALTKGAAALSPRVAARTPREAFINVDGGKVQRYTSPATVSRIVENAYNRLSEKHPKAPVIGAEHRAIQRTVVLQEREMGHLRADVAKFSQMAKDIKGVGQKMAYDRLHQYGWRTPEERNQALAWVDKELATLRTEGGRAQARTVKALTLARPHIANPSEHLLATLEEGIRVMDRVEQAEVALGRLTPETAAARKNVPAQLAEGARFDQETGKFAMPSETVKQQVGERPLHTMAFDRNHPKYGTYLRLSNQDTPMSVGDWETLSRLKKEIETRVPTGSEPIFKDVTRSPDPPVAGPSAGYLPHTSRSALKSIASLPRSINTPKGNKRTQGILFTTGRARFGPKLVTEAGLKSARTQVVLKSIDQIKGEWAKPWKPGEDIPEGWTIWNPDAVKLPRIARDQFDDIAKTPAEVAQLMKGDYEQMVDAMFSQPIAFNSKTPVYVIPEWVAKAFRTGQMRMPGYGADGIYSAVQGVVNAANNLFRLRIYVKPSYLTNFFANEAVGVYKQGPWHVPNLKNAVERTSKFDAEALNFIDELAGTSASVALEGPAGGRGALGGATSAIGQIANRVTDLVPRRTAVIHELGKRGFKTNEQVKTLKADPSKRPVLNTIMEEAQNSMGRFEGLGPREREYLTTWIAVYPWLKAATRWSVRMPWDTPVRAAVVAHAGTEGWEWAGKELGGVADWLRKYVPLPWANDKPGQQTVTNLGGVTPLSTGLDVGKAAVNTIVGSDRTGESTRLAQLLSPPVAALGQAAFGVTPYGRESGAGIVDTLVGQQDDSGLPRMVKEMISPTGETKYWADRGRAGAVENFVAGPFARKTLKLDPAQKAGAEEKLAREPSGRRAYIRDLREEQARAKKAGVKMPRAVVEDLLTKNKLDVALDDAEKKARKVGRKITYKERLEILGKFVGADFSAADIPEAEAERLYDKFRPYVYPTLERWHRVLSSAGA